jgi:hypothetical protein
VGSGRRLAAASVDFRITGNAHAFSRFLYDVTHAWQNWLHRGMG